jgi:hypothetical protein
MILQEAMIGGTLYLDYLASEMALPESERVAFVYRALTNREKVDLLHRTGNRNGMPNGADVCEKAITKIRNLYKPDGTPLDTISKLLDYHDGGNEIAYMITITGSKIWTLQMGNEEALKNSE